MNKKTNDKVTSVDCRLAVGHTKAFCSTDVSDESSFVIMSHSENGV